MLFLTGFSVNAVGDELHIGVLALRGAEKARQMWGPTADYLSERIDGHTFTVVPVTNNDIAENIENDSIDFVLANPALYASLENTHSISRIATLKTKQLGQPYTQFGAVIFTRADRRDIGSLADLKGKSFMAVHPRAFGGWWMALYELSNVGIDPEKEFSKLVWSGFPQDSIVFNVIEGKVDAGTVRTNILERLAFEGKIRLSDIRVVNAQSVPGFPFLLSTRLYPEWAFAKSKNTPEDIAVRVAVELLSMPSDSAEAIAANSDGWTVPLDYQPVHKLMLELGVGPYKYIHQKHIGESPEFIYSSFAALLAIFVGLGLLKLRSVQSGAAQLQSTLVKLTNEAVLARDEIEKRNAFLTKVSLYTYNGRIGPSEKLHQLLLVGCELFSMEYGIVEKIESDGIGYSPLEKVLCNDDMSNLVKQAESSGFRSALVRLASSSDSVVTLRDLAESSDQLHGIKSFLGAPIVISGKKYAVLSFIGFTDDNSNDQWQTLLMRHFAYLIAQLIEKEMLMQQLVVRHDHEKRSRAS